MRCELDNYCHLVDKAAPIHLPRPPVLGLSQQQVGGAVQPCVSRRAGVPPKMFSFQFQCWGWNPCSHVVGEHSTLVPYFASLNKPL